ncbi:MAG: DUF4926 domain-containing protein [Desulfamplus sp.]|nr:DUF4926 domain-containing protein [Desulfamplus sp.]
MSKIGDIIELTQDMPKKKLMSGSRGTIVHCHNDDVYEIEFTDENGETLDFLALNSKQFIVVWRIETKQWVPIAEQVAELTAKLPDETTKQIFDFARFLSARLPVQASASF